MRMRFKPYARPELLACDFHVHEPLTHAGHWHELYARPEQPLHLELGCGKGGFLSQLAPLHPDINYLGIDITDKVLILAKRKVEAAYAAAQLPPDNVKIASLDIERLSGVFSPADTVQRIYINFCNPWSKNAGSNKHRLTHPRQLLQYRALMPEGSEIYFKTDDDDLFRDSLGYFPAAGFEITWQTFDLHKNEPDWNLRTEHEGMFSEQGIPIKALIARKGPDSSVTWVEPKELARRLEPEEEADPPGRYRNDHLCPAAYDIFLFRLCVPGLVRGGCLCSHHHAGAGQPRILERPNLPHLRLRHDGNDRRSRPFYHAKQRYGMVPERTGCLFRRHGHHHAGGAGWRVHPVQDVPHPLVGLFHVSL